MREDSGTAPNLNGLPVGGGGIAALGDRFQPDLVRGSGSYAVSIDCPKGPNEQRPSLGLSYSTGSGNGPFGLGWRLNLLRIERRSDRGIPNYNDDDTFVIGDAEVLVPVGDGRYRPKTDTKFWKITRTGDAWQIQTGDGKTMKFGQTAASREADDTRVFAWYMDEESDAAGNTIVYSYRRDQNKLYLEEVQYSIFRVRFLFESRPDSIRNGRSGFLRVTAQRVKAVELHCERLAPTRMRIYSLTFAQAQNGVSLLAGFALSATDGITTDRAPALTFDYSASDYTALAVHEIQSFIAPSSLESPGTQLVDMTGDGLPDVLQSSGSRMLLWRNGGDGSLAGPEVIDGVPSTVSLAQANVAWADLNGDGRVDLFAVDQPLQLAFVSNGRGGFQPDPVVFHDRPNVDLASSNTRLMDIDGDGVTDLINAGRDHFLLFRHLPGQGWQEPIAVARVADPDLFPDAGFQDRGVQLADMTGDGLQDFLSVRSLDVSYWPYLGNGVWGNRVVMENPPQFPSGYRDNRLLVIDLDGDGCSDIVYFDNDRTLIWLNQSGVSFAAPIELQVAPNPSAQRILPADFFGDGRTGFLWTASGSEEYSAGYRFLRFDEGRRPYLLTTIQNGLGRQTTIEYATTTGMRLQDEAAGESWRGQLPFVVPVVSAIRDLDTVSATETGVSMRYHDGIYDGAEREFRGFTRTTVELAGDDSIPVLRQEHSFFQGDPDEPDVAERTRQRALAGSLASIRTFEKTAGDNMLRHESTQTWDTRLEFDDLTRHVFFPFLVQTESRELSPAASPQRIDRTRLLDYDAHGNAGRRIREFFAEGDPPEKVIRTEERFLYTQNEAVWLVKLPLRSELRDAAGVPFSVCVYSYDGAAFQGLPEGQAARGMLTRTQELVLLESKLPLDYLGSRNLATLGYELRGADDTRGYYATTQSVRRDGRGNIIEQRDPMGALSQIVYDGDGVYPLQRTGPRGETTRISFDPRTGEPSLSLLPDGRQIRVQTDLLGRTVAQFETDDAGAEQLTKCWTLDVATVPVAVTAFTPTQAGREAKEFLDANDLTQLSGVSIVRTYLDGFGNQSQRIATAADGPAGTRRFAASGQFRLNARKLKQSEFPEVFTGGFAFVPLPPLATARVRYRYDAQGSLIETMGPGPAHFHIIRDTFTLQHFEGASAGVFGEAVPPGPPTRKEFFDARDRVTRIEEAKGGGTLIATSYELTVDGRFAVIHNESGIELVRYSYAGANDAIRITHRDAGSRTYYWDAAGRIAELVRPDGSRLLYRYDVSGRLTRIEHAPPNAPAAALLREVFYDTDPAAPPAGRFLNERIALVREAGNEMRYSYNRAGSKLQEAVTVAGTALATSQEYNQRQEMTALIYPDGRRIEYVLDASGAIQQVSGFVTQVSYYEDGKIESYTFANGVACAFPRDLVSRRLTRVSATRAGATLRSVGYSYDDIGNIVGLHDEMPGSIEHHAYTYDGLYRLTHHESRQTDEAGPVLLSEDFRYDSEGNLLQLGPRTTLAYADAIHPGRATTVIDGGISQNLLYEDRGSVRSFGELTQIDYDPLDRVSGVTRSDGVRLRFDYDPQNRRVLKETVAEGQTRTVRYAGSLYEKHDTHALRNIYFGSTFVASETVTPIATQAVFFLADHHGTILLATDSAGAILQNQRYSPFGQALDANLALDRYLGKERDQEIEILQLGSRFYAPAIGRFISPDWYVLENPTRPMRMPQGFNAYSYALNNPLVFKDPSGKWFFLIPFIVGFVAGLVYGLADGQKWGAFGTALETGLTTGFGALLGGAVETSFLSGGGLVGATMGGINGLFTGLRKTYDWGSIEGWASFVSDSTWGLIGTSLGNVVNIRNLVDGSSGYRSDLSERQNRQVYDRGFNLKGPFSFTQGNVISNLGSQNSKDGGKSLLKHETTHILQNRIFGPFFPTTYIAWVVVGGIVGAVVGLGANQKYGKSLEDVAYYDNPWEQWAYAVGGSDSGKGKLGY